MPLALGIGISIPLSNRPLGSGFDPNAAAFFADAGITDATQKAAVNQFVLDLKATGLWPLMFGLYPLVGGTAGSHAINLKNTATFEISWFGTITHNANGVTGDGSSGVGITVGLSPNTLGPNGGYSFYKRTTSSGDNKCPMGVDDNAGDNFFFVNNNDFGQKYGFYGEGEIAVQGGAPGVGLWAINRLADDDLQLYKDGASIASNTNTVTFSGLAMDFALLARNSDDTPMAFVDSNYALFALHSGMTPTQAANFYTAIQLYQTTLGRQI